MIVDCHAHIFTHWIGACGHPSREIHKRYLQRVVTRTVASTFRIGDGARADTKSLFRAGDEVVLAAREKARVVLFGGEPLEGERTLWWNFVSSRKERIAQAAEDWKAGRFAGVPGDREFIPLPDNAPKVVDYP